MLTTNPSYTKHLIKNRIKNFVLIIVTSYMTNINYVHLHSQTPLLAYYMNTPKNDFFHFSSSHNWHFFCHRLFHVHVNMCICVTYIYICICLTLSLSLVNMCTEVLSLSLSHVNTCVKTHSHHLFFFHRSLFLFHMHYTLATHFRVNIGTQRHASMHVWILTRTLALFIYPHPSQQTVRRHIELLVPSCTTTYRTTSKMQQIREEYLCLMQS